VIDRLREPGVALDVPGRTPGVTPDSCAAELVREIDRRDLSSVVLVLHSLAGVLAPGLSRRLGGRLVRCVFVSAVVPPSGGAFVDALPLANRLILRLLFTLKPRGLKPSPSMIRRELCNDLSADDAELVVSRFEAELPGLYLNRAGEAPHLPQASYVKLLRDRSVKPARQDVMIARLARPRVYEIAAGHLAMLSTPAELSAVIDQEATSAA
jgi:pimeloyl-ACP methyl ester carboxylesterase